MTDKHIQMKSFMDNLPNQCPTLFNPSNSKFFNMVRSRMIEDGLGLELSTRIANALSFDVSGINEDDDLISQAAGKFAEYAGKVYDRMIALHMHKNITDAMIQKYFAHTHITL